MENVEHKLVELFLQDLERWDPLLVALIRKDEIDPWSVDIERLSKAYLGSMEGGDFRKHGKTVLTLAILLKLKSESLDVSEFWAEPDAGDEVWEEPGEGQSERPRSVPPLVPIRARPVERRVTLGELVSALRAVMEQKRTRSDRRIAREAGGGAMEVRADLDIGRIVNEVYERIVELCQTKGTARFSELAGSTRDEAIWTLVSLLHLYFESTVVLEQSEWWGEIMVKEGSDG
jgi:chromatin segregation and condensation protein Rec8/ScpA/Scc1 (kleisin family)